MARHNCEAKTILFRLSYSVGLNHDPPIISLEFPTKDGLVMLLLISFDLCNRPIGCVASK